MTFFWKQLINIFCSMCSGVILVGWFVKICLHALKERSTSTDVIIACCESVTIVDDIHIYVYISIQNFCYVFWNGKPLICLLKLINFNFNFISIFSTYFWNLTIVFSIKSIKSTKDIFNFSKLLIVVTSTRKWVLINVNLFSTVKICFTLKYRLTG